MAVVVLIVTALPLLLATAAAVMVAVMAALAPADRQRHLLAVFNGLVLLVAVLRPGGGAAVMESNVR